MFRKLSLIALIFIQLAFSLEALADAVVMDEALNTSYQMEDPSNSDADENELEFNNDQVGEVDESLGYYGWRRVCWWRYGRRVCRIVRW